MVCKPSWCWMVCTLQTFTLCQQVPAEGSHGRWYSAGVGHVVARAHVARAHAHGSHKVRGRARDVQQAEVLCDLHLRQRNAGLQRWTLPDGRTCRCTTCLCLVG